MFDLLVRGGTIVTLDRERRIIEDGYIGINGDHIAEVGKLPREAPFPLGRRVIEAKGDLITPGFIDGHLHILHYLAKGLAEDIPLWEVLYKRLWPYEAFLEPDDVYLCALGSIVEMAKHGTTCFLDPGGYHMEKVAQAIAETGFRGIIARDTRDHQDPKFPLPPQLNETTDEAVERARQLADQWHGKAGDRVRTWFSLRNCTHASDALCRRIKDLADGLQVGIHMHAAGSIWEREEMKRLWGMSTLERFRDLGLLGANLYLVHMGWVEEEEIELLRIHDVKVCHCPSASMARGMGCLAHGMFPKMLRAGITISLGCDNVCASRYLDMIRLMYLAAYGHKEICMDPAVIDAYKALEMATIDGARAALWDDGIGSIAPGKKADIVILNLGEIQWWPLRDPVTSLVYSGDGDSVRTVLINGQVIVEEGRFLPVDEQELIRDVCRASDSILERMQLQVTPRWKVV